ncbi:hypothetical protein [Pantoea sp. EEL5]
MTAGILADGIALAASHPVQGQPIWGNVATGLITAGAAIVFEG